MPIAAPHCGHAQDVLQKMSDPVLSVCPACGAPTFVKQVTAAGFQLKGSGWYVTDFRGDKKAAAGGRRRQGRRRERRRCRGRRQGRRGRGRRRRRRRRTATPARSRTPLRARPPRRSPAPAPAAPRRQRQVRRLTGSRREEVPDRRPAGLAAAGHHHLGAGVGCSALLDGVFAWLLDAHAGAAARRRRTPFIETLRHVPGLGVLVMLVAPAADRRLRRPTSSASGGCARGTGCCNKIPIVKSIYSSVKQVSDTLFSSSGNAFREAVLVQYPRAGLVDDRLRHRQAGRRGGAAPAAATTSASTCRRRRTRPRASS